MDDFSDFSILIPSKSGGQSLVQLLNYLMKELPEVSIKVLLSGSIDKELKKLAKFSQLDIHEFKTEVDFFSKLKGGLDLVSSEIVAVLTDDDIFLADSLANAASFLNENRDFSACHGYFGSFECHGKDFAFSDICYFTPSIVSNSPLERMGELLTRYQPICWAVFRTEALLNFSKHFTSELNFLFNELLWSCGAVLTGKVRRMPEVFCLRKQSDMYLTGHPLYLFLESPQDFIEQYKEYRKRLLKIINYTENHEPVDKRTVDLLHTSLFIFNFDLSTINFFANKTLINPSLSIFSQEISELLLEKHRKTFNGMYETRTPTRKYHFSHEFCNPGNAEEIELPSNFREFIVRELERFFSPKS